ncbi:MAG TPA: VOC family protein [Nevskia sp.]|nr:VOC family protein [Nevskia sp.]
MRTETRSTIIPCLRYRDAPAAIEWLCRAFGFDKRLVVPGENNTIAHAQLTLGGGMVMLGSTDHDSEFGRLIAQPGDIGERETQSCSLTVADADAHYARAKAAGARIIMELKDNDFGGRGYACRDPEGHHWWIGSYDPWD